MESEHMRRKICDTINRITHQCESQNEVDKLYVDICDMYFSELEANSPPQHGPRAKKRGRHRAKPWWCEELQILWENLVKSENALKKCTASRQIRKRLRNDFKEAQNDFDRKYNRLKRQFQRKQEERLFDLNTNDPREFWKQLKNLGPKAEKDSIPIEVITTEGEVVSGTGSVLREWEKQYSHLYTPEYYGTDFNDEFHEHIKQAKIDLEQIMENSAVVNEDTYVTHQVMNGAIQLTEVRKVVQSAKNNKSPGVDALPNEVFKNEQSEQLLCAFFNKCFLTRIFPSDWCKAVIKPIPKGRKYDPRLPMNYRGISLLCTMYKLYTSILNNRLVKYLESNGIFVDEQNGFRKHRACIDHLYTLSTIIRNRKHMKLDTFSCFIDMRKAFDSVDRTCMFYKLLENGVSGLLYYALKDLYANPIASVMINSNQTQWFPIKTGVRQGDNLSTTLFALFVNDLALQLKESGMGITVNGVNISVLLYADDIVILAENEAHLQSLLDIVHDWTQKWRLLINVDKTKVVHFRRKCEQQTSTSFKCGDKNVDTVSSYRYLGCELNEHLDYTQTATILAEAAGRALGALITKHKSCGGLHHSVYKKYYETCIAPIMDYCSAIWGYKTYDKCDTIQNRALRSFLGVHRYASNLVLFGDTGWTLPVIRRRLEMIRFWYRLLKMENTRLTKHVFLWESRLQCNSWYRDLKDLFTVIGKPNLIERQTADGINLQRLLSDAEKHLMTVEAEKWKDNVKDSPKLRTYILFKEEVCEETYLTLSRPLRSYIAQIRCGILPLRIETGRYGQNPLPPDERICQICNEHPETEIHFIFQCKGYIRERNVLFNECQNVNSMFLECNNREQLKMIFKDSILTTKLALYIRNAFNIRRELLYIHVGG